jgi:hypothetical protein
MALKLAVLELEHKPDTVLHSKHSPLGKLTNRSLRSSFSIVSGWEILTTESFANGIGQIRPPQIAAPHRPHRWIGKGFGILPACEMRTIMRPRSGFEFIGGLGSVWILKDIDVTIFGLTARLRVAGNFALDAKPQLL